MINNRCSNWHCCTMLTSIFTKKYLISLTVVNTYCSCCLYKIICENQNITSFQKTILCIVQQLVLVRANKVHLNAWNIISITLQKWSLKRDKISFVFTKFSWEPILDLVQSRSPYFLLSFWSRESNKSFQTCFVNYQQCKRMQLWLYDIFGWFQALSNTFKLSVEQPPSIDQADSC